MVSWQIAPAPERRSRAAHPAGENPSSRSARTRQASTGSAIRRLGRGRLLSSSARCCAPTARYRSRPPLRPTSLLMVDASRPRVTAIEANGTIGSSTRKARISSRSGGDKAEPGMLGSPSVRLHVCTGHHDRIMHRPMEPAVAQINVEAYLPTPHRIPTSIPRPQNFNLDRCRCWTRDQPKYRSTSRTHNLFRVPFARNCVRTVDAIACPQPTCRIRRDVPADPLKPHDLPTAPGGVRRACIAKFSQRSRRRMAENCVAIPSGTLLLHYVTVTYPGGYVNWSGRHSKGWGESGGGRQCSWRRAAIQVNG